jgi:uncharacterized hydantoinase/oxoprolinase family protein
MAKTKETVVQRRERQLRELIDTSRRSEAVREIIRIVCTEEGATSAHHLLDINPKAFDLLVEAATSLIEQLGEEEE